MARLHIQIEDGSFVVRELNWGVTRIGRSSENDITIAHPSLSQRHCELELGPGFLKVRDLGSTNGTFISDRPVTEANLAPGDRLRLGHVLTVDVGTIVCSGARNGTARMLLSEDAPGRTMRNQ